MSSTFGSLKQVSYQSDYIKNKKYKIGYLNGNSLLFNKNNLIAGLYSKMNLNGVCNVINGRPCSAVCDSCDNPASIDANSILPFNQTNTIDPIGELFGNSQCGIINFTKYMEYDKSVN